MNDMPSNTSSVREAEGDEAARISLAIARPDGGSDPFASAVRATRMPMIVTNPRLDDNPVVFANDSFCRLTGYSRHEIIGRNCRFLQGPETNPEVVAKIRAAVREARSIEIDIRNHRKDGEAFWNRLLMAPVYDAEGTLSYFFASQVDVTIEGERLAGLESHNAALMAELAGRLHEQKESEARLRFATQAGRLGIWELDLRTSELTTSAVCKENFGYAAADPFSYEDLKRAIHPEDQAGMAAAVEHAIATGTDYDLEYRVVRPDQSIGWVQVRARVVHASDGAALRMAGISFDVTERRSADLRLKLSEESLRLTTQAAEIGTWDLDLATDTLDWSDRTKAMFGISPDVPCSMPDFYNGLHPDDRAAAGNAFASAIDPSIRAPYDVEYRTVGKEDGVTRWVAAKGKGLFDGGRCYRALGTAINITARKIAETRQALRLELGDRLRQLTDPDEILQTALTTLGRHMSASRAVYGQVEPDDETIILQSTYADGVAHLSGPIHLRSFGMRTITLMRQGVTIVQDDVAAEPLNDAAAYAAVETQSFISVPLVRDGRFRAALVVTQREPHRWAPEDVALVEDIAARTWDAVERARAEAALREANILLEQRVAERTAKLHASEVRLRTIFETSYQLQGFLAPDGTLLDANGTSLAAVGAKLEDVVGKPFWETPWFTATPGMPELVAAGVSAAARGATISQEISVNVASGTRCYDFSIRPIHDERGEVIGIVPEAMDITERRHAEEAFRQSQKMEAVGQLTGGLAHDFNNLLTGITGSLELLQTRMTQGRLTDVERYINAAQGATKRAAALTHRLLAFSRRQTLDPRPTDINRLIAGMEELITRAVGPTIEIEVVGSAGLWTTSVDQNQLENALLNLCINARDAMPDGGRLTIETANKWMDERTSRERDLQPGQFVSLCVTDTGTGMTPEVISRAFDPFFTTKPLGAGTGLGLSMIYGFVRQSGGQVRIYSELGKGTTMCLYLPRHLGAEDRIEETAGQTDVPQAEHGETVLVVDDEPTVRMLVTEVLHDQGYTALEAGDGAGGLRLLQSDVRIDLLVTDVGLPGGMNGRQVADAARALRPALKVLFITGYAENAVVGNGHLDPGMAVLTKPFTMHDLADRIRNLIGKG